MVLHQNRLSSAQRVSSFWFNSSTPHPQEFETKEKRLDGDLFQGTFDLHTLCPGHCRVSQAVSAVSPTTHVYSLLVKEAERLGHHMDGVVGEGRGVLRAQ